MPYLGLEPGADCLIPLIQQLESTAKRLTAGVTDEAMAWRPPDGGWSMAQVFEHLVVSSRLYLPVLRARIAEATPLEAGAVRPWKPSFFGRLLIRALRPAAERKIKTSKKLVPGPAPRENVVSEYLATLRETADVVWHAQNLDTRSIRLTSPVSKLVRRLNLGDAVIILVVHAQRHMKQIERIQASPGFPARTSTSRSNPAISGATE